VEEVTEGPIQGPKKTKREVFGQGKGRVHDCSVYKEIIGTAVVPSIEINADGVSGDREAS
jgi:hypothetical protein